jgi:hypothetical protein
MEAAEHDSIAVGDQLTRRERLLTRELHLAVDREQGVMYLQREAAVLRKIPVRLNRETIVANQSGPASLVTPRGRSVVVGIVEGS